MLSRVLREMRFAGKRADNDSEFQRAFDEILDEIQEVCEFGMSEEEKDKMRPRVEMMCLAIYKEQLEVERKRKDELLLVLADARAEIHNLSAALGETTIRETTSGTILGKLEAAHLVLDELRKLKDERVKEIALVQAQIQKITTEIGGTYELAESVGIEEADLSLGKLEELQSKLQELKKEKSERLTKDQVCIDVRARY